MLDQILRIVSLIDYAIIESVLGLLVFVEPTGTGTGTGIVAHAGALRLSQEPAEIPRWLVVSTGGGVVGASFLFTSLMTDHGTIRSINDRRQSLPAWKTLGVVGVRLARVLSVVLLGVIVLSGVFGARNPRSNVAILVVWAGWWAGYTISVYLVGNTWPALNPWRTLVSVLPRPSGIERSYPHRLGVWPSVVGLLGLVWLEVISPIATTPSLLALVIVAYSLVTIAGATVYGADEWFTHADPISQVFRWYGRVAPFQRTDSGIDLTLPSTALTRDRGRRGGAIFVVALLWATTYDGLISTPLWNTTVRTIIGSGIGIPALVVYAVAMCLGFVLFLFVYRSAVRLSRRTGRTYVAPHVIEERFVLSLLPIAAGYHLAHYLGYFLSLSPSLAAALVHPFGGVTNPQVLVLPDWFGQLQLLFVLCGHLFAVWVAHATAFELFTGKLQPIRSQYPLIVVMILYTVTSMWIVIQPYTPPPFV